MGAEKILRNTGLLAASGVVALALAMVPAAPGLDAGFLGLKAAQAKGNGGNGGGHGNANGHGKGAGVSGATLDAHGKSTPRGELNWPSLPPTVPHFNRKVPLLSNF